LRQALVDGLEVLGRGSERDVLRAQADPAWCQLCEALRARRDGDALCL
jgi:hypothetical protein